MSISLAEALQQVQLEAGKTYRYETAEHLIEVRVRKRAPEPQAIPEPDVMLEPWVALPHPSAVAGGCSKLAEPLPPVVPDIPAEEES